MKFIYLIIFILIAFSAISSKTTKGSNKGGKNNQGSGSTTIVKNGPQIHKDQREKIGNTAEPV